MKLFEHADFEQAILGAEAHFHGSGWNASFLEKDYFATEALRLVAREGGRQDHLQGRHQSVQGMEPDSAIFRRPRSFFRPDGLSSVAGKERHQSGAQRPS